MATYQFRPWLTPSTQGTDVNASRYPSFIGYYYIFGFHFVSAPAPVRFHDSRTLFLLFVPWIRRLNNRYTYIIHGVPDSIPTIASTTLPQSLVPPGPFHFHFAAANGHTNVVRTLILHSTVRIYTESPWAEIPAQENRQGSRPKVLRELLENKDMGQA